MTQQDGQEKSNSHADRQRLLEAIPTEPAIGYLAFDEAPDKWTWIGAAVIMTSSVYIAHREAGLRRAKA